MSDIKNIYFQFFEVPDGKLLFRDHPTHPWPIRCHCASSSYRLCKEVFAAHLIAWILYPRWIVSIYRSRHGHRPVPSSGHQGGRRVFLEGPKFLTLCPIHLNYVQNIFPWWGRTFFFSRGGRKSPSLVTGLHGHKLLMKNTMTWRPVTGGRPHRTLATLLKAFPWRRGRALIRGWQNKRKFFGNLHTYIISQKFAGERKFGLYYYGQDKNRSGYTPAQV